MIANVTSIKRINLKLAIHVSWFTSAEAGRRHARQCCRQTSSRTVPSTVNGCDDETTAFSLRLIDDWGLIDDWALALQDVYQAIAHCSRFQLHAKAFTYAVASPHTRIHVLSLAYVYGVVLVSCFTAYHSLHTQPLRNAQSSTHRTPRYLWCGGVVHDHGMYLCEYQ